MDQRVARAARLIENRAEGLYCPAAQAFIDPVRPVDRAIITHGHGDHARSGHGAVLATPETLAIMRRRYGEDCAGTMREAAYGEVLSVGDCAVRLEPAGHVLGSAQVVIEHEGSRVVVSGDYKRRPDPTCRPFQPVKCDIFISEATFGLPVFRHPPVEHEVGRLLESVRLFPERAHLVGVYALGKAQRLICELRKAGWDEVIYIHGALAGLCRLYEDLGVTLGPLSGIEGVPKAGLQGKIVLAPPSTIGDRWSRRLPDPVTAVASGWMGVRARARQRGVELPLIVSDHADWSELLQTIDEVVEGALWVTHGAEEALVHVAQARGLEAQALRLVGYDAEDDS
ncbi:ligase-associated DNA damage response exonuclease [Zavarzinia sp. CC-PAN008]|uniref:ligase-associated DNA damage response exonuclease n=1 Tax=Zavarzinia sp. CC-PAN008 TaxID=3243332 RepID=UPI003F7446DD